MSFKTYTLTVLEKVVEAPNTVTIKFKQPALKKIRYTAGQYITLIVNINGRRYRRPYSISSVFGLDATIDITVKSIPNGIVSNYIVTVIKVGDILEVLEPMGHYSFHEDKGHERLYFWCAGSGITPNYSIIRDVLAKNTAVKQLVLIYSNRNIGHTIFRRQLDVLESLHRERLAIHHIHTFPDELSVDVLHRGRIDAALIQMLIKVIKSDVEKTGHYICGPQQLKELIISELKQIGTDIGSIFTEDYYLTKDLSILGKATDATIQVTYKNDVIEVFAPKGVSVLDACLDAGIDLPYSCQSGTCTLCKAVLLEGKVQKDLQHQPDFTLEDEEVLTCCSYALTSRLKLKIM